MSDSEECQGGPEGEDQVGEEPLTEPERHMPDGMENMISSLSLPVHEKESKHCYATKAPSTAVRDDDNYFKATNMGKLMTTQWSVEDEEEAARERRRREREKQLRSQAEETLNNTSSCSENEVPSEENQCDFKPSGTSELEEDEGFSDWSQKLEQRKQRSPRQSYEEEDSGLREAEVKMEQVQLDQESPEEVNQEENEELKQKQLETEEYGQLCEEEHGQEQQQQEEEEEEEEQQLQEDKKRRRNEEEDTPEKRPKAPSPCSFEEDEECSGQSPPSSTKITDRTESLNRSIQKSNSIKKTQPPLPVSKIDDRLEQYTHAIETSAKTPKPVRQPSIDLPAAMVVASTKSLWETGEVAAQASPKTPACKDIVAGDIVSKRSLWEQKGGPKLEGNAKSTPGKKYKFVSTGHGQYKKVLIDDATEQ